jgi:cytochrome c
MGDHRFSTDVSKRLSRQPGGIHAGGNKDQYISHERVNLRRLYVLQDARQTGYLSPRPPLPLRSQPAMNSFELNKILGALLGTCLLLLAVHIASGAIFTPATPAKPGYEIAVKQEQAAPAGGGAAAPGEVAIDTMLGSASVQAGEAAAKICEACHNLGKGQGNKIGPDLYGVVGRKVASEEGFNYSPALKAKGGTWTFDALSSWLKNPRADVPGTLMTFAGLPSEKQRADVIDYLNSNSDKPLPLPKAAEAAPAGGGNPPAAAPAKAPDGGAANPPANNAPAKAPAGGAGPANPPAAPANPAANAPANPTAAAPASPPPPAANPPANGAANPPSSAPAAEAPAPPPANAPAQPQTNGPPAGQTSPQ